MNLNPAARTLEVARRRIARVQDRAGTGVRSEATTARLSDGSLRVVPALDYYATYMAQALANYEGRDDLHPYFNEPEQEVYFARKIDAAPVASLYLVESPALPDRPSAGPTYEGVTLHDRPDDRPGRGHFVGTLLGGGGTERYRSQSFEFHPPQERTEQRPAIAGGLFTSDRREQNVPAREIDPHTTIEHGLVGRLKVTGPGDATGVQTYAAIDQQWPRELPKAFEAGTEWDWLREE